MFRAVSSVASKHVSVDGHSLSASLLLQAFPSLHPLRPGTKALAQCLQFSAASLISLFRSDQEIWVSYIWMERNGSSGLKQLSDLMWEIVASSGLEGICWLWPSGLLSAFKLSSWITEKTEPWLPGSTNIPEWESSCLLKTMRAAAFHTCCCITICPVIQHLVRSCCCHPHLSPLLKNTLPVPWPGCATTHYQGGRVGFAATQRGVQSSLPSTTEAFWIWEKLISLEGRSFSKWWFMKLLPSRIWGLYSACLAVIETQHEKQKRVFLSSADCLYWKSLYKAWQSLRRGRCIFALPSNFPLCLPTVAIAAWLMKINEPDNWQQMQLFVYLQIALVVEET